MAAIAAVPTLGTLIGHVGAFVGLISSGVGIMNSITQKPSEPDYYTLRMEIGDNQDASGNPPTVIFSDFANHEIVGVYEGNSRQPKEQCRNFVDDIELYNGLRNAEAPIRSFKTNNGFNLKSLDIQPGGNAICVSNIILKGSDTQARRDEIFIPLGDLGFQCGHSWNWGAILNGVRQRCVWLDGQPDGDNKPIQSLHLDMENLAGIFNKGMDDTLAKTTFEHACSFITDNVGKITNRNACKESYTKRSISDKSETIDTVPTIEEPAAFFTGNSEPMSNFVGAPFITSDNKLWNSTNGAFIDVTPKTANKRSGLQARRDSVEGFKVAEKRGLASTIKGERCEYVAGGSAPQCNVVKEFSVAA